MELTAMLLLSAACAAYVFVQAVYFVHMLQDVYKRQRLRHWRQIMRRRVCLLRKLPGGQRQRPGAKRAKFIAC